MFTNDAGTISFPYEKNWFFQLTSYKKSIADSEELNVEGKALKYMEDDINKIVE